MMTHEKASSTVEHFLDVPLVRLRQCSLYLALFAASWDVMIA